MTALAPILAAHDVTVAYGDRRVVDAATLEIGGGERVALVGPNGAGKSSLLRAMTGVLRPSSGSVHLCGAPIDTVERSAVARTIAVVPELIQLPFEMPVHEVVALGRLPHEPPFTGLRPADHLAVAGAMERVGIAHLAPRDVRELSMGERQLVFIAVAVAQAAPILVLDEPTAHLDIRHQVDVMELLVDLNQRDGTTIVAVLHDLALAAHFFPRVAVLSEGRIVADGAPATTLGPDRIRSVFGVDPGPRAPSGRGSLTMEHVVHPSARSVGVVTTIRAAVGLLTRLPVGVVADVPGAAAFALVGAVIGGLAAAALVVLALAGEPVLGAITAVGLLAAVSGGLHLDGLADTADALVAPDAYAAERAREDPSVGPGGAVALLVVLGAEVAALASVTASWGPVVAGSVVVVGGAVSRWLPVLAVVLLRDRVGHDGLGAWFSNARLWARRDRRGGHDRDPDRGRDGPGWIGARSGSTDRRGGRPGRDGLHHQVARPARWRRPWCVRRDHVDGDARVPGRDRAMTHVVGERPWPAR